MVKATSLKKKILLFLYGVVLLTVMVLLGGLIYTVRSQFKVNLPSDSEYKTLFNERKDKAVKLNELNSEYREGSSKLKGISDLSNRKEQLNNLTIINNEILTLLEEMILIDTQILELNLTYEVETENNLVYQSDLEKYELYEAHLEGIKHQLTLNDYYLAEAISEACFGTINYAANNREISKSIDQCLLQVDKQIIAFNQIKSDLPKSKNYLAILKDFWSKNSALYIAIEEKDSATAKALDNEVQLLSESKESSRNESNAEISKWIAEIENSLIEN